ncbi:MAG: hypothetical protein EZS28_023138 [Streblomastix strix]|uniref:Transcription factor Pcc1 n=1 Tax=Streblomastix strix TaxID=222440 RepID=A0A5J4VFV8_9EUKA|nr:MAG: hypothetical protein EZS28_023138 [Streblomastix strix]
MEITCDISVDTKNNEDAVILQRALSVDPDLFPQQSSRLLTTNNNQLLIHFRAISAKNLRVNVSGFMDLLALSLQALALADKMQ